METQMTLHDFVLKLLVEPGARAEFELDPEGVLAEAGLSDITAADVQEVIPLVVDYAPVEGVTGLVDLDAVTTDPTSAVSQLQGITQALPVAPSGTGPDLTIGATAVAGVSLDLGQLDVAPVTLPGLGIAPAGNGLVGVDADPADTIDVDVDADVDTAGVVGTAGATDPVGSVVGPVTGPDLGNLGNLGGLGGVGTGIPGVDGLTGSLTGAVPGVADSTVTGVTGAFGAVTGNHSAEVGVSADPTAATHTGSVVPGLGGVTDTVDDVTGVIDIFH